jgi:hypothetical protein
LSEIALWRRSVDICGGILCAPLFSGPTKEPKADITVVLAGKDFLEIQLDNWRFVTTVKKVSPRVSFLGYLKFFK